MLRGIAAACAPALARRLAVVVDRRAGEETARAVGRFAAGRFAAAFFFALVI
jgi:hypothetical protein